ncbi:MAG: PD40 domain-containing protein [Bryobacterales bacterium]|nr:PD40 domain-containing protein [Bryobacterales bacterium]
MPRPRKKKRPPKRVLALPDLDQSKNGSPEQSHVQERQRTCGRAITDFVDWCCSEPRLAFNRIVVLRYRIHLEQKLYAPATSNLRLAAVRRVAYEAADSGLLSPELGAGIREDEWLDWNPVWSPDDKCIYFSSNRSGVMTLWSPPQLVCLQRAGQHSRRQMVLPDRRYAGGPGRSAPHHVSPIATDCRISSPEADRPES